MAVKVCLDAGHYGKYNRSPAVSSYYESDMTWKLHNYLKKELEAFGIVVVTTRTNQNTDRALYERGAASKGCNLFISVHSNAVGNGVNENVDYPVAYVLLNGSSTDIGLKLAKVVESVMGTAQSGRTATRQGTNGEYYGVLRGANAVGTPGIILEHSFHTNTRATKWLSSEKSSDLFMKCRYLDEITGNRGVVFATGTPISNSMVEMYSVQRYLQYDTLARNGLQHFDSWASTFGETVTALEIAPELEVHKQIQGEIR